MRLFVQTWDEQQSIYRATNCTGVSRRYSVLITHGSSSTIKVMDSITLSPVLVETGTNISDSNVRINGDVPFAQQYICFSMLILEGFWSEELGIPLSFYPTAFNFPNILGSFSQESPDGNLNIAWNQNMPEALEQYAENVTFSILSGQIFAVGNPEGPDLLENLTTTCDYTYTAYEYTPSRLFVSYGVAILVTTLCCIGGARATKQNGVDESMAFSRFLRAVLNERMYNARERLDLDSVIKADDNEEGSFAPSLGPTM